MSGFMLFKNRQMLSRKVYLFLRCSVVFVLLCFGGAAINAQTDSTHLDSYTPVGISSGGPATVNTYNGNLSLRLPLLSIPNRGGLDLPIYLLQERHWIIDHTGFTPSQCPQMNCDIYTPLPSWWSSWSYGASHLLGRNLNTVESQCPENTPNGLNNYGATLVRLTFTLADGTEYELRDQLTGGKPLSSLLSSCYGALPGNDRGKIFITADGTSATFISDYEIHDQTSPGTGADVFAPSGYLMMRDGTRYRIDQGKVTWIRDANGNRISFEYDSFFRATSITDSLNRRISITYSDVAHNILYDEITYRGYAGETRVIRISYDQLANVFRHTRPGDPSTLSTVHDLFPEFNGSSSTFFNPYTPSSVQLPDGRLFHFYYNEYGELTRLELPTGGAIEYDYKAGLNPGDFGYSANGVFNDGVYRRVSEVRTYPNGATLESKKTYLAVSSFINNFGINDITTITCETRDANSNLLEHTKDYFYGSPISYLSQPVNQFYPSWMEGKEYQTEIFGADYDTPLRRVVNTWQQRAPISWWSSMNPNWSANFAPENDPRVTESTITLTDANKIAKQIFGYDQYNNRTDQWEYDYGDGSVGPLMRHRVRTFLTSSYDTINPNSSSPSVDDTYHLRNLPTQESIYDAQGVERSRATYEYDNYGSDLNHAGLTPRSNISGLDSRFTPEFVNRGNITGTTGYLLVNGTVTGSLSSYLQYDIAGNLVKAIDGRGNSATIDFDDRFGVPQDNEARSNSIPNELSSSGQITYAFPTKVTNPLGQTAYTQFDYYLARPVNVEDPNGIVSSNYYAGATNLNQTSYTDPLDRLSEIVRAANQSDPHRSQTKFSFNDAAHQISVTSDLNAFNDNLLKGESLYDGFNRTTESHNYEGSTAYITTKRFYDAMGRVQFITNPYRSSSSCSDPETCTDGWTRKSYDIMGRVIEIATFSGSVDNQPPASGTNSNWTGSITTDYYGMQVLVKDQVGNERLSQGNALGQLTAVWEIAPGSQSTESISFPGHSEVVAGYKSSYQYDTLDDVVQLTQRIGSSETFQSRNFVYDSLKRLVQATNPESGTTSYTFDNNGNLLTRSDVRGVTTTSTYDSLNRPLTKQYSDGTPSVFYYYDNQALPSGAPNYSHGASIGNLLAITYGGSNNAADGTYYGYDIASRMVFSVQRTENVNYPFVYDYNIAGEETAETYPSGRVVKTNYDTSGRTVHVYNDSNAGGNADYVGTSSNPIMYTAMGGIKQQTLGNSLIHQINYNSRLQPTRIQLDRPSDGQSLLELDYLYGIAANINDSDATINLTLSKNNGNIARVNCSINGIPQNSQTFQYDSLNRLLSATEAQGGYSGVVQWQQLFSYDRFGNRSGVTSTALQGTLGTFSPTPSVDQSTNRFVTGNGFSYDAAGNVTHEPTATGASYTYTYDAENRLVSVNDNAVIYSYDGEGYRTKKTMGDSHTVFVRDAGGRLIAEYDASDAIGYSGAVDQTYALGNQLSWPAQKVSYSAGDLVGSTRVWTDSNGSATSRHDYAPFGEEIFAPIGGRGQGFDGTPQADGHRMQFTGQQRDTETGLDYFGARYSRSGFGRFLQADPTLTSLDLTNPQSLNRYAYCLNNPIAFVDPNGQNPLLAIGAIYVIGNGIISGTARAIHPPPGHGRLFSFCVGYAGGVWNGGLSLAGILTGNPIGVFAGAAAGAVAQDIIEDLAFNHTITKSDIQTMGKDALIGGTLNLVCGELAEELFPIARNQFKVIYPLSEGGSYVGNARAVFAPRTIAELTSRNVGRTAASQLGGGFLASSLISIKQASTSAAPGPGPRRTVDDAKFEASMGFHNLDLIVEASFRQQRQAEEQKRQEEKNREEEEKKKKEESGTVTVGTGGPPDKKP